jgi:hypothetical protein
MKTNKRMLLMLPVVAILTMMLLRCTSITGGGEIGNPITITGKVVDKSNRGVADLRISILSFNEFNPVAASLADTFGKSFETIHPVGHAVTDSSGAYTMTVSLTQKTYALFGQSVEFLKKRRPGQTVNDSGVMVYHPFKASSNADTIFLIDTACIPATVIVGITDSLFKPNMYVFACGTPIFVKVESVGRLTLRCPAKTYSYSYYWALRDSVLLTIPPMTSGAPNDRINGTAMIDFSYYVHKISKPQRPSGSVVLDFARQDSGNHYTTGNAVSNLGDTLQYRLAWDTNSFSQWVVAGGTPMTASLNILWPSPGTFTLRAIARSIRDTNVVSPFSDTLMVTVY